MRFFAASLVDAAKTDAEAATLLDVLIPVISCVEIGVRALARRTSG